MTTSDGPSPNCASCPLEVLYGFGELALFRPQNLISKFLNGYPLSVLPLLLLLGELASFQLSHPLIALF